MSKIKNLKITDVEIYKKNDENMGLKIFWTAGDIGCGVYTIDYDGEWSIDSVHMDDTHDKEFGKLLLNTWLNKIKKVC